MNARFVCGSMVAACLLASGCLVEDGAESQDEAVTESDIVTTYNGDLSLLGSYNELFDKAADTQCVRYENGGEHARVAEPSRDLSIELVKKKEELAQKLGVDLNMKTRYAMVGGNAAIGLVNEYTSATNAVTFLLSARSDYVVRDVIKEGQSIVLTQEGKDALAEGPGEFSRRCGTHYVDAVRYGARFYLLITYQASSHESKTKMDANLGIDGGLAGSGDIKSRLERAAKTDGVNVTIKAASNGFWLDSKPAAEVVKALESASVDQNLFAAASQLYFAMTKEVENEFCMDAGQAQCRDGVSPGYFARSQRDAAVTGVQLGAYHTLKNATWESPENPFEIIKGRVEAAKRFVRNYSELEVRMDNIYNDEIRPFLESAPKDKAMFNIAPPGKPLRTPTEVFNVAMDIDELIYPPTGGVMGWLRKDIHDRIVACLDKVNVDIIASCTSDDELQAGTEDPGRELEADETKAWNELYAFFEDYHNNKRILPLHVTFNDNAVTFKRAQEHCDSLASKLNKELAENGSSNKIVYRLARGSEIKALAPVLSHGNVQWTDADIQHATWYNPNNGNSCSPDYPYYKNEPAGSTATYGCALNDWWDDDLVTICVPASGPIPLMDPQ